MSLAREIALKIFQSNLTLFSREKVYFHIQNHPNAHRLSQMPMRNLFNYHNLPENYKVCYQRGKIAIQHSGNLFQQSHLSYKFWLDVPLFSYGR